MHLVYTTVRDNLTEFFNNDQTGEGGREVVVSCIREQEEAMPGEMHADRRKITTFLVRGRDSEEAAKVVAERIAQTIPGEDVYIAKVTKVVSAIRPQVIIKEVTERGVLPA